jgi:hypothetical protein
VKRNPLDRWAELARYLKEHRICNSCAKTFAALAVRAERGRGIWQHPLPCDGQKDTRGCREMARSVWPGRPGAELQNAPARVDKGP